MRLKKYCIQISLVIIPIIYSLPGTAQDLGMSFSFFFPKNGYFSTPVSPFSLRGLGIHPTNYFSIETGFSLYRMAGLNMTEIPYETKEPLMGPLFSVFVPLEAVLEAGTGNVVFRVKGGGFGFYNFANRINYGNFDRAIADYNDWQIANADLDFDNKIGLGYLVGGEIIVYVTQEFGINMEVNYLAGGSDLNLRGTVTGGDANGLTALDINLPDARLDFSGWEITIGVLFSGR